MEMPEEACGNFLFLPAFPGGSVKWNRSVFLRTAEFFFTYAGTWLPVPEIGGLSSNVNFVPSADQAELGAHRAYLRTWKKFFLAKGAKVASSMAM